MKHKNPNKNNGLKALIEALKEKGLISEVDVEKHSKKLKEKKNVSKQ